MKPSPEDMSSTRDTAEQLTRDAFGTPADNPIHATAGRIIAQLTDAIDQALRQHEREVRAEERERAAGIVEAGAMLASPDGVIPSDDPEHEQLQRLSTILMSAATAIRRNDTPQEGGGRSKVSRETAIVIREGDQFVALDQASGGYPYVVVGTGAFTSFGRRF